MRILSLDFIVVLCCSANTLALQVFLVSVLRFSGVFLLRDEAATHKCAVKVMVK